MSTLFLIWKLEKKKSSSQLFFFFKVIFLFAHLVTKHLKNTADEILSPTTVQRIPLNPDQAPASWNVLSSCTDLEHEHGELLIVLPLLHCRVHVGRRGRQRGAAALAGKLPVELGHLLKLLPQVLGDDLGPFCTDKPQEVHQQQRNHHGGMTNNTVAAAAATLSSVTHLCRDR